MHARVRRGADRKGQECTLLAAYSTLKRHSFYLEFRRCHPSFPAFLLGSPSPKEGHGCPDHDGFSACSPSAIRLLSGCILSSSAMLSVWRPGQDPCLHHATSRALPPQPLACRGGEQSGWPFVDGKRWCLW